VAERDGAVAGSVVGTLIHGLFDNDRLRADLLDGLRRRRGLRPHGARRPWSRDAEYDRLAAAAREHLDLPLLHRLAGVSERSLDR
jgi:adenosylcobyric acid synthase